MGRKITILFLVSHFIFGIDPDDRGYIVKVGDPCPDFSLTMIDGKSLSLNNIKGKVVVLQFTASWCSVCRKEMPHLETEVWQRFKDEDFIIGGDAQFKARVQQEKKKVRKVYLAYYETSNGRMGIWPITVAAGRMMSNKWIDTATQIVEEAQKKWVKFVSNQTNSCYDCFRAREVDQEQYGEPKFKLPYNEIIVKAFGKDFTLTPDTYEENEYVQQSIGEQIGLKVNKDE